MRGMTPTYDQGLEPAVGRRVDAGQPIVFSEIATTISRSIAVPKRKRLKLYAELYGGGGSGAGGGYNTGGTGGGGGACTVFDGLILGPCIVSLDVPLPAAGGIYGAGGLFGGATALRLSFEDGSDPLVIAQALGGRGGTTNLGQGGASPVGGAASPSSAVFGRQFSGNVVSFGGGAASFTGGSNDGYPGGPQGAGSTGAAGAGNRSGSASRGGAGNGSGSGGGDGAPGGPGLAIFRGKR